MPELGPCPLCGETPASDELSPVVCYDCGFYLESAELWNRLSQQGELWRLLEWAQDVNLYVEIFADGSAHVQVPKGLDVHIFPQDWRDVCEEPSLLDAIREAKKKLEARPVLPPGVFTISRRIP